MSSRTRAGLPTWSSCDGAMSTTQRIGSYGMRSARKISSKKSSSPSSSSWMRRRKSPDCAPWMIRWSYDVLVALPELREVHRLHGPDRRHQELPGAVVLCQVDRDTEIDVLRYGEGRFAADFGVGVVHLRELAQRPDHRVADEVRERHLA